MANRPPPPLHHAPDNNAGDVQKARQHRTPLQMLPELTDAKDPDQPFTDDRE